MALIGNRFPRCCLRCREANDLHVDDEHYIEYVRLEILGANSDPDYMYLHSINVPRNVSTFANISAAPGSVGFPFHWVWNPQERQIWAISTNSAGSVGLTKVDPVTGVAKFAQRTTFSQTWSTASPAPTIDPVTNTWVQIWTDGSNTFIVSVDTNGQVVSKENLNVDGLSTMSAFP